MADGVWNGWDSLDDTSLTDVIDSVDSVDTGNSTSADIVDLTAVVSAPSVINNTGSVDEDSPPAPNFSVTGQSAVDQANFLNGLVNDSSTTYDPFSSSQLDYIFADLLGVDGPTQVKNSSDTKSGTNNKSSNSPVGGSLGNAAKAATGLVASKTATPKQNPSTDPISKFLLGNASNSVTPVTNGSLNWNNLAIILTIVTSLIIIFIFIRKGHT